MIEYHLKAQYILMIHFIKFDKTKSLLRKLPNDSNWDIFEFWSETI